MGGQVSPKGGRLPSAEGHQTEMGWRAVRGWQRLGAQLPLVISHIYVQYVCTPTDFCFFFSGLVKSVQCSKHDPRWLFKRSWKFLVLLLEERLVEVLWVMDLMGEENKFLAG